MIYFIGAGPGAPDLITVRGMRLLQKADVVIYAGSLVNPELLAYCRPETPIYNSASMTLEETIAAMQSAPEGATVVRLHTGDPCLYGAIAEQMRELDRLGLAYEVVPGVSSFCGAAAAIPAEYTLPWSARPSSSRAWRAERPCPNAKTCARWRRTGRL